MMSSQHFVVSWIYFMAMAAIVLQIARATIRQLSQPADRLQLIQFSLLAVIVVPLLMALAPLSLWRLPLIAPSTRDQHAIHHHTLTTAASAVAAISSDHQATLPTAAARPLGFDHASISEIASQAPAATALPSQSVITSDAQGEYSTRHPIFPWDQVAEAILAVHAIALIYFLIEWGMGVYSIRAIRRMAITPSPAVNAIWDLVTQGRGNDVQLLVSRSVDAPLMYGWQHPIVILPCELIDTEPTALRFCLAHEWSHIERRDMFAWNCVRACQYLLWLQPSYWALRAELRLQQDILADDRSTRAKLDAIEYSELLIGFANHRMTSAMNGALTFLDHPTQLTKRIKMLLENPTIVRSRSSWRFSAITAAMALLAVVAIGGARLDSTQVEEQPKPSAKNATNQKAAPESPVETQTKDQKLPESKNPPADKTKDSSTKPSQSAADQEQRLQYHCRVVDNSTNRGIPNAHISVRRSAFNSEGNRLIQETKHNTDADGNYVIEIPADQVVIPSLYIELDVEHEDYAGRKGFGYALGMIRKNEKLGERPFFETTELSPADPVTGTIISPDGTPVSGIKVQGFSMANRSDFGSGSFSDCVTDANGRFRLNVHKDTDAVMWIIPKNFASSEKFLAKQRGDLGTIRLSSGVRVKGRITSAEGKPVTGVAVNINFSGERDVGGLPVATSVGRGTVSDADGKFAFDPLPPGTYRVMPAEYIGDPLSSDRTIHSIPGVYVATKVVLNEETESQPIEIQAVPHVLLNGQIFDSAGKKRGGHEFSVFGQFDGTFWHTSARPGKDGEIAVRIPHGLQSTRVQLSCNEHEALRCRSRKNKPLEHNDPRGINFGTMNDDVDGFEIVYHKAPIVLISAVDEQQQPIRDFRVAATYPWGNQIYVQAGEMRSDIHFEHQNDGRYRTSQMVPDEDVKFTVTAPGYESMTETIRLAEGATKDLVVKLKKGADEKQPPAANTLK